MVQEMIKYIQEHNAYDGLNRIMTNADIYERELVARYNRYFK